MSGNDIVVLDPSASRYHAQVLFEPEREQITAQDLGSTNGTYVNRDRLIGSRVMTANDVIRIGQHLIELSCQEEQQPNSQLGRPANTQMLTRDLVLEAVDQHAVLLAEVASRLNTIMDLPTALKTVSNMMKVAMGADRCEVILIDEMDKLSELGFARSIAQQAIQQRSAILFQDTANDPHISRSAALLNIHAAMCVPIISNDEMLGLIYIFKNRPRSRPFEQRDMQLAVAISHQAALTIQRMKLMEKVRKQQLVANLLNRFLSPQEARFVLDEYLETGQLPPMQEYTLTMVALDMCKSTQMAERLGARRFGDILAAYYQEMTDVIFAQGGMLNKYRGDGLMAVFGLPHQPGQPEERAITCAINIIKRIKEIEDRFDEPITVGVGINTGPVMAGYLGNLEFLEFTIVGFPVNLAWSLESLAPPNRILLGHTTYQAVDGMFNTQPLGPLEIKSLNESALAYEVIP